jgi:putative phosphoribosyl transferase
VEQPVRVLAGPAGLDGDLATPTAARGVVLFAHGSGSGRHSPRNRQVAAPLGRAGFATLLLDLLTLEEEAADRASGRFRFDVELLAGRLGAAADWLAAEQRTTGLPVGLFGASTGVGAALLAAAERPQAVAAVVSRGGRPDLAGPALGRVLAPTLLIVGALDPQVLELNWAAWAGSAARRAWRSSRAPVTCSRSQGPWSGWPSWPSAGSPAGSPPDGRFSTADRVVAQPGHAAATRSRP